MPAPILIPVTIDTDPAEMLLEPHVLLRCPGSGKRHGQRCRHTLPVPLTLLDDPLRIQEYAAANDWVALWWCAVAEDDEEIEYEGETIRVDSLPEDDRVFGVIECACANHAQKWIDAHEASMEAAREAYRAELVPDEFPDDEGTMEVAP